MSDVEMSQEYTEFDELASLYSDFHKDVYGFRPRFSSEVTVEGLRAAIDALHASQQRRTETFAGREQMREDGWWVLETDPELQQQSVWLAEERDRYNAEREGDYWNDATAEAPRLRKAYGMEG